MDTSLFMAKCFLAGALWLGVAMGFWIMYDISKRAKDES